MPMGIVSAKDPSLLHEKGGHLVITSWAKSLLKKMEYMKRKSSNAGKVTLEEFLADIKAEVLMDDIPILT